MSNIVVQKSTMPKGWGEFQLGDIGEFFGGVTSVKKSDYGHGYPFLQYTNVYKNWKVDIHNLKLMNVKESELVLRNCIYGDIFFTASSETNDEVAVSSVLLDEVKNLTYNGFCKRFRLFDFDTLLPEFARYLFRDRIFRGKVYQLVTGDVRFNISQESLASITLIIPTIPEQKNIAETLSSLDDKINLLRRQNKTLETMAQTLFRKWFIEDIQHNWDKVFLGDFFPVITGKKNVNYSTKDGKYPFFTCSEGIFKAPNYSFEGKAILLTGNGNYFRIKRYEGKFEAYQRVYVLIPHKEKYFDFLYFLMGHFLHHITGGAQGSVIPFIIKSMITDFSFALPKINIDKKLDKFQQLNVKIDANQSQIRTLEKMRDLLLPKLMSGKIKIGV